MSEHHRRPTLRELKEELEEKRQLLSDFNSYGKTSDDLQVVALEETCDQLEQEIACREEDNQNRADRVLTL